jgi:hypothetical protein
LLPAKIFHKLFLLFTYGLFGLPIDLLLLVRLNYSHVEVKVHNYNRFGFLLHDILFDTFNTLQSFEICLGYPIIVHEVIGKR